MKKNKKWIIALALILVTGALGFGYNFFSGKSDGSTQGEALTVKGSVNVAQIAEQEGLVPGDNICDAINLKIESTAVSLLRVHVEVSNDGNVMSDGYIINGIDSQNWIDGNDGYYYYNVGVKNNDTVQFATGIYFGTKDNTVDMNKYQGTTIKANIHAELVQAKYGVFTTAWGINSTSNPDVYNKLKEIPEVKNSITQVN